MNKSIFITGATGFIGNRLAHWLADSGCKIVALVRTPNKTTSLQHPNIQCIIGSLEDEQILQRGMKNADFVYHLAAHATLWAADDAFERVNIEGTINVLNAALQQRVKRVVVTSTAGVIGPATDGPVTEETKRVVDFFNDYERTKYEAELIVKEYVAQEGLDAVMVNPTRVYGPGQLNESNAVTKLIKQYAEGRWRFLPGDGTTIGNYVFIDDVVQGHILAMEKGKAGERYLLGGEDVSYNAFFNTVGELNGQHYKLQKAPMNVMLAFSKLQLFLAQNFGRHPVVTPAWVKKYMHHWQASSAKAERELGYQITPLKQGIQQTLEWLKASGL